MNKVLLQLNHEIQRLQLRVFHWGRIEDRVNLDAAIARYREILEARQKEKDEIQAIVEELERESIFEY